MYIRMYKYEDPNVQVTKLHDTSIQTDRKDDRGREGFVGQSDIDARRLGEEGDVDQQRDHPLGGKSPLLIFAPHLK